MKATELTQKDRESIEHFFQNFEIDGVLAQEDYFAQKEWPATVKSLGDIMVKHQEYPTKLSIVFKKKRKSCAANLKESGGGLKMKVPNNSIRLFNVDGWQIEMNAKISAKHFVLPGFIEYIEERHCAPPLPEEIVFDEDTKTALQGTMGAVLFAQCLRDQLDDLLKVNYANVSETVKKIEALLKRTADREKFQPLVNALKSESGAGGDHE